MLKNMIFVLVILSLVSYSEAAESRSLWGTSSEVTTYQSRYCPLEAPTIPVMENQKVGAGSSLIRNPYPTSPETAIKVVDSSGRCFSYYYSKAVRYRYNPENPSGCCEPVLVPIRVIIPCDPPEDVRGDSPQLDSASVRFRGEAVSTPPRPSLSR